MQYKVGDIWVAPITEEEWTIQKVDAISLVIKRTEPFVWIKAVVRKEFERWGYHKK